MGQPDVIHDFDECLRKSHAAEDLPFWEVCYRQAFIGFASMTNHRKNGEHQMAGIDRSITLENAAQILIDEKVRWRNRKTGQVYDDILLEFWSVFERRVPGWVCKPLRAHYIAYAIAPLGKCYLLPVPQLQAAWLKYGDDWKSAAERRQAGFKIIKAQNNGYWTHSLALPVTALFSAIGAQLRFEFDPIDGLEERNETGLGPELRRYEELMKLGYLFGDQ